MFYTVIQQPGIPTQYEPSESLFDFFQKQPIDVCTRYILSQPAERFTEKDASGYLLIHRACLNGNALVVAALLHIGCDPSAPTEAGLMGVHLAAMRGQVVILALLAEAGANLEQKDPQEKTPLHHAAASNQVVTASWLLQVTQVDWATLLDQKGQTPLHLACAAGHEEMVRLLLTNTHSSELHHGSWGLLAQDHTGNTCLHSVLVPASDHLSNGSSVSESITFRALKVTWTLLTAQHTYMEHGREYRNALCVAHTRNNVNETPLDLAVKHRLGFSLYCLLFLAHLLNRHFFPGTAQSLFILIYRLVWLFHLLLPGLIVFITFLLGHWSHFNGMYIIGALLAAGSSIKQRHRLNDGTNRPNPYFLGAFLTGSSASFTSLWYELYIPPRCNFSLFVFFLFSPIFCFVMYTLVFWNHPTLSREPHEKITLSQLVSNNLDLVRQRLSQLRSNFEHPSDSPPPQHFSDVYCAHCDVHLMRHHPVSIKHCRLCNQCRLALDHHCLFVMNCITRTNLRYFILFLFGSVCFICCFCLLAIWVPLQTCPVTETQSPVLDGLLCLYDRFPRSTILIVFQLISGLWILMLLSQQCSALSGQVVRTRPQWKRRSPFSGLRFSLRMIYFLLWGDSNDRSRATVIPSL